MLEVIIVLTELMFNLITAPAQMPIPTIIIAINHLPIVMVTAITNLIPMEDLILQTGILRLIQTLIIPTDIIATNTVINPLIYVSASFLFI